MPAARARQRTTALAILQKMSVYRWCLLLFRMKPSETQWIQADIAIVLE